MGIAKAPETFSFYLTTAGLCGGISAARSTRTGSRPALDARGMVSVACTFPSTRFSKWVRPFGSQPGSGLSGLVDSCHDAAGIARNIELARLVPADRSQITSRRDRDVRPRPGPATPFERPDAPADEISKNVATREGRHLLAVIDMSADHCRVSLRVVVVEDGIGQSVAGLRARRRERMRTFAKIPAQVGAAFAGRYHVHFFKGILPDVSDPQISAGWVKREPKRIAQSIQPDFAARILSDERVALRDGVVEAGCVRRIHIDAQHLPEQHPQILSVALRVAGAAAIARADVEKRVRTKDNPAALVI